MPRPSDRALPLLLVLCSIFSVQFGGAIAATLVPLIGAGGSVLLRLTIAALVMLAAVRPTVRGLGRDAWVSVALFGAALAGMNYFFYCSLATLPIGAAVTIEFLGPLLLAAARSRRLADLAAVLAAGLGVALVSGTLGHLSEPLDTAGVVYALLAGVMWAAYIVVAQRAGGLLPGLDGLALALPVAAAITIPLGVTTLPHLDVPLALRGAGIALMSSMIPYSLELLALRRLDQRTFGILLSLEPAVAAMAGLLILDQTLGGLQLLGMLLVITASAIVVATAPRPDPDELRASEVSGA